VDRAPLGAVTVPEIDPVMLALAESAVKRNAATAIKPKADFLCKITKETLLPLNALEKCWTTTRSGPT
jgi:hypothetical protein